jgi:hypothetical protein
MSAPHGCCAGPTCCVRWSSAWRRRRDRTAVKTKILDAVALASLSTTDLTAWLKASGWVLASTVRDRHYKFTKSLADETFEVEVPYNAALRDYHRRVGELLDVLEVVEERSQAVLLRDIRQAQVDITRLRLVSDATRRGRIPVEQGATFFAQARDLMLAAACATIDKRPVFTKRKPTQAMDFVRALKYGPSEEGSYVATIESPVPPALQLNLDGIEPEPPFERKVMLTLAEALRATGIAAGEASANNDISPFIDAVQQGLNANLCDALAGMVEGFEASKVEVGIAWAHSRPASVGPVTYSFPQEQASVLREAARILRERQPQPDFELEGVIVKLESPEASAGGAIVIACPIDGRMRRVKVQLDGPEYTAVVEAHGQEKQITVEGDLAQEGGGLLLHRPRNLRVLDE